MTNVMIYANDDHVTVMTAQNNPIYTPRDIYMPSLARIGDKKNTVIGHQNGSKPVITRAKHDDRGQKKRSSTVIKEVINILSTSYQQRRI